MWFLITKLAWYLAAAFIIGMVVGWGTSRKEILNNSNSNY